MSVNSLTNENHVHVTLTSRFPFFWQDRESGLQMYQNLHHCVAVLSVYLSVGWSACHPLYTNEFAPRNHELFLCWNSQSFHLHLGGVPRFTTQNMSWRGSLHTFIMKAPTRVRKRVRNWRNTQQNLQNKFCWQIPYFPFGLSAGLGWASFASQNAPRPMIISQM